MKSPLVTLTMPDGSERSICATLGKDTKLADQAVIRLRCVQAGIPIPSSRLDREMILLRDAIAVAEHSERAAFLTAKKFIEVVGRLESHIKDGTLLQGGSKHVH